jgi:hypothetical protein
MLIKKRLVHFTVHCIFFILYFLVFTLSSSKANINSIRVNYESPLEGRWDLTLYNSGKSYPAWLECSIRITPW